MKYEHDRLSVLPLGARFPRLGLEILRERTGAKETRGRRRIYDASGAKGALFIDSYSHQQRFLTNETSFLRSSGSGPAVVWS